MASKTIRFGYKDQKYIRWYKALKERNCRDISSIIAYAVEYHELTGRYIKIAQVRTPDKEEALYFNMYFPKDTFIYDWYIKHQKGLPKALRSILNFSITELPSGSLESEEFATAHQLEKVLQQVRPLPVNTAIDSIDSILYGNVQVEVEHTQRVYVPEKIPRSGNKTEPADVRTDFTENASAAHTGSAASKNTEEQKKKRKMGALSSQMRS